MAIGNLRDKLLKAGLVDKKQKQQADIQDRRDKKQKSQEQLAQEDAARQKEFEARLAAEAEAQRLLEAEREKERAVHEQRNRVRNICDRWSVRMRGKPASGGAQGPRRFYYVKRSQKIGHLTVNEFILDQLLLGALAIVERAPDEETHVLLPPEPAERVLELDLDCVRYWARKAGPIGFIADPPPSLRDGP
jgi:uncharacterized protein YaiL (DUF2058 family)